MRKHLIGTILVLAALAACNKEVETPAPAVDNGQEEVTPGKVTLTFKATIDEGTRTSYDENLQGSWLPNDAISVCVTDGTNYEIVDFTTKNGTDFTGTVSEGYTTIVSGVYPANNQHVFTDGAVTSVYLPKEYNLFDLDDEGNPISSFNDTGIALPMVGEMKKKDGVDTFTFHHICGALKITVVDIFNALTFTTSGEKITGSFPLTSDGRITMSEGGSGSTVTFNYDRLSSNPDFGDRYNRTFYIPIPDGTVTAGATMALKNANKTSTFFDKTTTADIEFDSNKIKRLPAIGFNTPQGWSIDVQEVENGNKFKINYNVTSGTYYSRLLISKSEFNESYKGSIACFVEERLPGLTIFSSSSKTYTSKNNIETYFPEKDYYSLMFGVIPSDPSNLDDKTGRKITFEFFKLDYTFEEPTQDYIAWIGKWTVNGGTNTDTWTISRKQANQTYSVTGLCGKNYMVKALFNEDGSILFKSQKDVTTINYTSGETRTINLYRATATQYSSTNNANLITATISAENNDLANLTFCDSSYQYYQFIGSSSTGTNYNHGKRPATATMTRVTE